MKFNKEFSFVTVNGKRINSPVANILIGLVVLLIVAVIFLVLLPIIFLVIIPLALLASVIGVIFYFKEHNKKKNKK